MRNTPAALAYVGAPPIREQGSEPSSRQASRAALSRQRCATTQGIRGRAVASDSTGRSVVLCALPLAGPALRAPGQRRPRHHEHHTIAYLPVRGFGAHIRSSAVAV